MTKIILPVEEPVDPVVEPVVEPKPEPIPEPVEPKPAIVVTGLPADASYTVSKRSKVEIPYTVEQPGGYIYMDTITYDVSAPMADKAVAATIVDRHTKWRVVMDTPIPEPTKESLTSELVAAQNEKVAVETKIAKLTAAVAAADAVVIVEKNVG